MKELTQREGKGRKEGKREKITNERGEKKRKEVKKENGKGKVTAH